MDEGTPRNERRIGSRVDIEPVEIRWVLPEARTRRRRSRKPAELSGWMVNISITGAAINALSDLPVEPGMVVAIEFGSGRTLVRVRTSMPTDRAGVRRYGVEFLDLQGRLKDEIYRALGDGRPQEDSWFRAT